MASSNAGTRSQGSLLGWALTFSYWVMGAPEGGLRAMAPLPTNLSLLLYLNTICCTGGQQLNIGAMWSSIKITSGLLLLLRPLRQVKWGLLVHTRHG